ncbi:hypothetical protein EV714DRAFT_206288 [Schizophyllum commune]
MHPENVGLTRHSTYYLDEGDIVVTAENTLFCFHSFHILRATVYFHQFIDPTTAKRHAGGHYNEDLPLLLDGVMALDMENPLWFFYESAYKWYVVSPCPPDVLQVLTASSGLRSNSHMPQVGRVACYALDRASALGDARKIALCARHDMGKEWAIEELRRIVRRKEPISVDEGEEMGGPITAMLASCRGSFKAYTTEPLCPAQECSGCYNTSYCVASGVHKCSNGHLYECFKLGQRERGPQQATRYTSRFLCADRLMHIFSEPLGAKHVKVDVDFSDDAYALGDLYLKAEERVRRIHSYHLKKSSPVFNDMLNLPCTALAPEEGRSASNPVSLDLTRTQLDSLLWFYNSSPYHWFAFDARSYRPNPELTSKWEDILLIADMFAMEEVCRVVTFALDHNGGLPDVRKISLCVRYGIDKSWTFEAIKRVCVRRDPLTKEEGRDVGVDTAIAIAAAREKAIRQCYTIADEVRILILGESAVMILPSRCPRSHDIFRDAQFFTLTLTYDFVQAEKTLFRFHFYHLYRATSFFDQYIATLESPDGGYSDTNPLLLDSVKACEFEHLLWFFYESAYEWYYANRSGIVDKEATVKWESIFTLAEQYKMKEVAKVACYALGRANALGDVRKIALCVKYDMGKDWITEELVRIISRANPLSMDEAEEMGARMTAVLSKARESMRHMPSSDAIPACSRAQTADECRECYSRRDMVCEKGIHRCIWATGHFTICPARDRSTIAAEIPDARTLGHARCIPQGSPACHWSQRRRSPLTSTDQIENDVLSVHAYHLERASQTFADMFSLPRTGTSSEGRSQDHPITLNVDVQRFKTFVWFLYESPYAWSKPELTAKWEDILAVGDMFSMAEVCSVATYAIDHNGSLGDVRKISLCVRHNIPKLWALEAIQRVCLRPNALMMSEARDIGLDMTTTIAPLRETAFRTTYSGGVSLF